MASPLHVLSLFSGIGGLDLGLHAGLERVGREPIQVGYVEREAFGAACLAHKVEAGLLAAAPVWLGDVCAVDTEKLAGLVDMVCGGFPCQDLSYAGKGRGLSGARSGLWFTQLRIACDVGARYVFVENVSALRSRGLDAVLGSLHESGFDAEWLTLRASEVGAPHRRERLFLLAHRDVEHGDRRRDAGQRRRQEPSDSGGDVAHSSSRGREEHAQPDGRQEHGEQARPRGHDPLRRGDALADDDDARSQGRCLREREGADERAARESGGALALPRWPPGPEDLAGWWHVLHDLGRHDLAPALAVGEAGKGASEPTLRGVADGTAAMLDRIDRLRAIGNGVVPLQAEVAFVTLWNRVHGDLTC